MSKKVKKSLALLKAHRKCFYIAKEFADETKQPIAEDSRAWSQALVSLLTGTPGLSRKKGADLKDGSDVKAANTWEAIDKPRFNGVIKSGTKSLDADDMKWLDKTPHLFFVLWDKTPEDDAERVRIWAVRPKDDPEFRQICKQWYKKKKNGKIKSSNMQLHPKINGSSNRLKNECGSLKYPLFFEAVWNGKEYENTFFDPDVLKNGKCISQ